MKFNLQSRIGKVVARTVLSILLFGASIISSGQTPVPGGNVSGTWNASGSPYQIQGSIMVPDGSTLTIDPGVTVNFQVHYKFLVLGRLLAIGTESLNIVITASNQSTGWYGLRFDNNSASNDSSILEYCEMSYGRITDPDNSGGAIDIIGFSKVRVSNCHIHNNYALLYGGGIDIMSCDPVITNNIIEWNTADFAAATLNGGGGISLFESNATISGNTIRHNSSASGVGGGAVFFTSSAPLISNNIIINNTNTNDTYNGDGGGGGIFADGSATIIDNTISNNTSGGYTGRGGGIYFYWNDNSTLINNTITNNSTSGTVAGGGGIFCMWNCNPVFTNNTIANNSTTGDGGALHCYSSSNPVFRNCIFYGNTAGGDTNQVYLYSEDSDPDFYYCDVQRGVAGFSLNGNFYTGHYENNIDNKPLFAWPSKGSGSGYNGATAGWGLLSPSPCINTGDPGGTYPATDKAGNPRVVNGIIDMGAYEYLYPVGITGTGDDQHAVVYPNPFSTSTVIRFAKDVSGCTLQIGDVSGRILKSIRDISGDHVIIEKEDLGPGIYFYKLLSGNTLIASGRLVVAGD